MERPARGTLIPQLLLTPSGLLARSGPAPNAEPLRTSAYEVRAISASDARPLVEQRHYARGMGHATACASLHVRACGTPVAVAVFNPPSLGAAKLMAQGGHRHQEVIGLSRLCFDPAAPKNAGSFLLARAIAALPERWSIISTYADEGQGVVGVTYQATNFAYLGRSEPRAVWTRHGVQVSVQRGGKNLTHDEMRQEGCVLAGRAAMHRYRPVRGQPALQGPQDFPKPHPRLI